MAAFEWCDAHIDLAYLALSGRDMTVPLERAEGPPQPAAVTLPSLFEGGVRWAFGTIFTGAGYEGVGGYERGDAEGAHRHGLAQLDVYRRWEDEGLLKIVKTKSELEKSSFGGAPLNVILLMECADPIRTPDEAQWWFEQGVRLVGLSWATGSRYAGGNGAPGPLAAEGKDLVSAFDELGIIHDVSHLPDESIEGLLSATSGDVIASHSNSRTLMGEGQRHLNDIYIAEIGKRGGVVGLNLCGSFITPEKKNATIEESVAHVAHVAEIMGRRTGVGLGSDMDGGFGADVLPTGIDKPSDLDKLAEGLLSTGWSETEARGFAWKNWLDLLTRNLPAP
ncbi:MAG: dipeptidase [Acidimicrobiia bacterium]